MKFDQDQANAVQQMLDEPISVTTGGPGCGKSTCVKTTLDACHRHGISYQLCAPTGKAARRLTETTGQPAQTIHRLLEWDFEIGGFLRTRNNPLDTDLVICDESSMIPLQLAASLLQAIDATRTRVVFIGDVNQLPPVGPGAFFRDLIAVKIVPTIVLQTVHRAAEKSWVYRNAPKILAGEGVELDDCEDFEWHVFGSDQGAFIQQVVVDIIRDQKLEHTDTQVIAPLKNRVGGVVELNDVLQKHLNPSHETGWEIFGQVICKGDRVMQTRNNYTLGIFNGEVGTVQDVRGHEMVVAFDGNQYTYSHQTALDLQLAYCTTVHRVQGSQFDNVIVVCHSDHAVMLTRQLLYTAVTRAKQKVYLVGDEGGLKLALRTVKDIQRKTLLQQRILGQAL